MMLYFTVTKRDGYYPADYDLFTSETNNVDVIFTSDNSEVRSAPRLDVRSTSCDFCTSYCQESNGCCRNRCLRVPL